MIDEAAVERVARALCVFDGNDPNLTIHLGPPKPVMGEDGLAELGTAEAPQWHSYIVEANRFIVANEALRGGD